ncbi:MAG: alanine racemase [Parachlamydiales bacterium]
MKTTTTTSRLTLSRSAAEANLATLRALLPKGCAIMAMVKGNGYGTGLLLASHLFQELGISYFGVATIAEGIALREGGIRGDILVYYCPPEEAPLAAEYRLEPTCFTPEQAEAFTAARLPVHLYVNLGLNRLGCSPDALPQPDHIRGLMTHLPSSTLPTHDDETRNQLAQFRTLCHQIDAPYRHALNSAGALRFSLPEANLVRIGAALYGFHKLANPPLTLTPAVALTTHLAAIQHCGKGESVGYEAQFTAPHATPIGVIPLGYHDGMPLRGTLYINGAPAPIVARTMDFTMCDLTDVPHPAVGDPVVLFDREHPLEAFAASSGRSAHETLSVIGPRVEREITP